MNRSYIQEEVSFTNKSVEKHYSPGDLLDKMIRVLKSQGKDINSIAPDDLIPLEELHTRGREATQQLIERLHIDENSNVLDLGSGIGGTSRYIASRYHCKVTGLDLSEEFVSTAHELTRILGLDQYVTYRKGDATRMPFENREFDFVVSQHAQMNIENKKKLVSEIYRVLEPGGYYGLHDIFINGGAPPPEFPLPWASNSSISFLTEYDRYKSLLEECGMKAAAEEDLTHKSISWMNMMAEKAARHELPPASLPLVLGEDAQIKLKNVMRAMNENKFRIMQAVFQKV